MRARKWAALALRALRALHEVRRVAGDALDADLTHSGLVCVVAELRDLSARALRRGRPRPRNPR